jgi:acetyl-CoA carboxylase biotin carboxyl carrier protein
LLTFEQIKELIELVSRHRLEGLEVESSGFRFKVAGEGHSRLPALAGDASASSAAASRPLPPLESAPAKSGPVAAPEAKPAVASVSSHVLTSPIVGTFYGSPSPEAAPFTRVGDRVRKGQVLCIVEAMKLMNEIESDADGIVAEIYPKNAQPVEFGEPLFAIRPE